LDQRRRHRALIEERRGDWIGRITITDVIANDLFGALNRQHLLALGVGFDGIAAHGQVEPRAERRDAGRRGKAFVPQRDGRGKTLSATRGLPGKGDIGGIVALRQQPRIDSDSIFDTARRGMFGGQSKIGDKNAHSGHASQGRGDHSVRAGAAHDVRAAVEVKQHAAAIRPA